MIIYTGNLGDAYRYYNSETDSYFTSQDKPTQEVVNSSLAAVTPQGQDPNTGVWKYTVNSTGKIMTAPEQIGSIPNTSTVSEPVYDPSSQNFTSDQLTNATSFVTGSAQQKAVEAADTVQNTFGGVGSFDKLTASLPSFSSLSSGLVRSAGGAAASAITSALGPTVGGLVTSALGSALGGTSLMSGVASKASAAVSSVSASQIKAAAGADTVTSAHRVALREIGTKSYVYFEVLPDIVENHTSEYEPVSPSQFPGSFQKYKGSSTTTWTINATFVSRTTEEATQNYDNLMRLRGWMEPFWGDRTGKSYPKKLGAPPPVLELTGLRDLIGPVPVVITSLNWSWPKDVDYIATSVKSDADGNYIPFPVVLNVPIGLSESYSIDQFNQFSLTDYRVGRLGPAFNNMESDVTVNVEYYDGGEAGE